RLDSEVLAAGDDRNPVLRWPDGALARHGELLWCLPLAQLVPLPDSVHWDWRRDPELSLDTAGALQASTDSTAPDVLRLPSTVGALTVKRASGGERILLRGMHRQVSELWRVAGVPPWQRQRLPLLYAGDALVAVAGIGVADDWQVPPDAPACCIRMCA
ncbi:MAG: tRNA lysidine(34) synthetase TilS, partial [Alcanivoracaceae bacterium]